LVIKNMAFIKPVKKSEVKELIDMLTGVKRIKSLGVDVVE